MWAPATRGQLPTVFRRGLSNLLRGCDHRSEARECRGQARSVRLGHITSRICYHAKHLWFSVSREPERQFLLNVVFGQEREKRGPFAGSGENPGLERRKTPLLQERACLREQEGQTCFLQRPDLPSPCVCLQTTDCGLIGTDFPPGTQCRPIRLTVCNVLGEALS